MDAQFRLISCVDPSKTPHQLNDKFAKLTLSKSTKKKHKDRYGVQEDSPTESILTSKKLFDDILTDDESDVEAEELGSDKRHKDYASRDTEEVTKVHSNMISSSSFSQKLIVSSDESDETFCSAENEIQRYSTGSVDMVPLRVSSGITEDMCDNKSQSLFMDKNEKSDDVEKLSLQVESLLLKSPLNDKTSQITSGRDLSPTELFPNVQDDDTKVDTDESILTISSSKSTPVKEVLLLSLESSIDEEKVITLTDSDEDECPNVSKTTNFAMPSLLSSSAAQRINTYFAKCPPAGMEVKNSQEKSCVTTLPNDTSFSATTLSSNASALENSVNETIKSTLEDDEKVHGSIEISETSCEEEKQSEKSMEKPFTAEKNENENSVCASKETPVLIPTPTPRSSEVSETFVESINISAKINIKIHISGVTTDDVNSSKTSKDSSSDENENSTDKNSEQSRNSSNVITSNDASLDEKSVSDKIDNSEHLTDTAGEKENLSSNANKIITPPSQNKTSPDESIILNQKEKMVLDKLYGNKWLTPEVLRKIDPKSPVANDLEETSVGNFTLFHTNIRTDLESTRLHAPEKDNVFKMPSSLPRMPRNIAAPLSKNATRSGRNIRKVLQEICDSDSSSDSAEESGSSLDSSWKKKAKDTTEKRRGRPPKNNDIVYLDLSSEVVQEVEASETTSRLKDILKSCEYTEVKKADKMPPTSITKTKRKLFSPFIDTDQIPPVEQTFEKLSPKENDVVRLTAPLPIFTAINKKLEAIKNAEPPLSSNKKTKGSTSTTKKKNQSNDILANEKEMEKTPLTRRKLDYYSDDKSPSSVFDTPDGKYGFLKSLDVNVAKSYCHPEALNYRENYKSKKDDLKDKLYNLYNEKVFKNTLNVEVFWNKKLLNTAGRCTNKKKQGVRSSHIELSEKVLTSADRLRCTLIHEMCHAATWIFNGENGHGATWKSWAAQSNKIFPELPKIGVCHQYDIEYKYTYKCIMCDAKSHAHSKSKKVENLRCAFCHGKIEVYLNKKDKDGNTIPTPVRKPTGFAKFVKDNYKNHKAPHLKHADVMKILSIEFAAINVGDNKSDKD